jgi:hypothetical protein
MALTPEEEAELAELAKSSNVGAEFRAAAAPSGAAIDQKPTPGSESELGGIQAVYGKDWTPYGAGGQPIAQTGADRARDEAALQSEAERVAGMLDPRFSLIPQVLALQPATNDAQGDEAARAKFEAGKRDPMVIYEPTVDSVRRHLYENPALLRAVSPEKVPTAQEIETLSHDSALYQAAADWMYQQADKVATEKGVPIVRYRDAPWLTLDPKELALKAEAGLPEAANRAQAFILGVDDMLTAGAQRAASEARDPVSGAEPTDMLSQQTRLGVNASVPHPRREVNAWTEEEYPVEYAVGQLGGMFNKRSVFNQLWDGIRSGGGWLAQAAAKTRLGGLAARELAPELKGAAGVLGDAVTGSAAAAGGQAVQESVDALGRGEPLAPDAGERIVGTAKTGGYLSAGGSVFGRLAESGAQGIRKSERFSGPRGPGAVGRTEANMDWRFGRGPKIKREVSDLFGTGEQPGDIIAEQIAPPIRDAAQANTRAARVGADIERRAFQATDEGRGAQPVSHLERMSLEKLRDHHQPQPDGSLRPVDNNFREAQQVFNRHVDSVSLEPVKDAIDLSADEAEAFLGPRLRYKLLKDDIEAARGRPQGERPPIKRDEYLQTIKDSRARAAADEEIEASIEDIVGDVTPTPARRERVEQQVLRELVDEASFTEANGPLGAYLKQRGKDRVFVKPAAYDARRADTLVSGLKDPDLVEAAKYDRQQFRKDGERGGYELMRRRQDEAISKAEKVEKNVAGPDGDAFGPVAGLYQSRPGEKQLVDQVRGLADQVGVREQLDRLRSLQETEAVSNRARFRGPHGESRSPYAPQNAMDAFQLRVAFPALRALEGSLGPLRAGNPGRLALVGGDETAAAQARAESGPRGRYEASRERRLKEIEQEKAERKKELERRQTETIRRRR